MIQLLQEIYKSHIKNAESQFKTIEVEMQALRRQMEAVMHQLSSVALDLHKANNKQSHGSPDNEETSRNGQMIPHTGEVHPRVVCLDFPTFHCEDPLGWLYKVNQFFYFPQHHMQLVSLYMEGKALVWFQDLDESGALKQLTRLRQVGQWKNI